MLVAILCVHYATTLMAHTTFITHSTRAGGNSVCLYATTLMAHVLVAALHAKRPSTGLYPLDTMWVATLHAKD